MGLLNSKNSRRQEGRAGNSLFPAATLISLSLPRCPCFQRDIKQKKVSNIRWVRHAFSTALVLFFVLCSVAQAQGTHAGTFTESEIKEFIAAYHTEDPRTQVEAWRRVMPHPEKNPKFAEFQAKIFKTWESSEFASYKLDDPPLIAQVQKIIEPVLHLYNRADSFKLIIIKHHIPVSMNDSSALLMISTGLLERAQSDDELLAHIAHELAHDMFWRRTAKARETLDGERARGRGDSTAAKEAARELSFIELECDAFAAITLAAMGRTPAPFARYLKVIERDFKDYVNTDLPLGLSAVRAKVIDGVIPTTTCQPKPSAAFVKLKAMLLARP
jgi:hypothetical protein